MTLHDWCRATGILPTSPTTETGAVSLCVDQLHPDLPRLFHLEDYVVSSRSGPVVWFVPRKPSGWERVEGGAVVR